MTYTPIAEGSLNWDDPVNAAFTSQDSRVSALEATGTTPAAHGLLASMYDQRGAANSTALTSGALYLFKLNVTRAATSTGPAFYVSAAGVTLTAGQNFVALYNSAGTRVAVTADQSAAWASIGYKTPSWAAAPALSVGTYYLAFLTNGATGIALAREANLSGDLMNAGLTAANFRYSEGGTGLTGLTATPASVTMANRATSGTAFWAGIV